MRVEFERQRRNSGRRGNAMVEFALSFALLFPVLAGAYQFGYAFFIYNEMQTAVRAGARYASLRTYNSATSTPAADYLAAVQNVVVYGSPAGGEQPVVPGLEPDNVTVTVAFESGVPRQVTVGIENYQADAVFRLFDFDQKPHVTMPYVGRFDPL